MTLLKDTKTFFRAKLSAFIHNELLRSVQLFAREAGPIRILQVGANDGQTLDPLYHVIRSNKCKAVLVEAVPYLFKRLQSVYDGNTSVTLINKVVVPSVTEGLVPFYYYRADDEETTVPEATWWGSLSRDSVERYCRDNEWLRSQFRTEMLPCVKINEIVDQYLDGKLDLLHTDVEGLDAQLVHSLDFSRFKPLLILFEHYHLDSAELSILLKYLAGLGYKCYSHRHDTVCMLSNATNADKYLKLIKRIRRHWLLPVNRNS